MPYSLEERDGQTCVVKDSDGTEMGCHDSRADALAQIAALYASEAEQLGALDGVPFSALLIVEGLETDDARMMELGSVGWRDLPLPLMFQDQNPESGGHSLAWFAGAITEIFRDPEENTRVMARGRLRTDEQGTRAEQMIRDGLNGVSVDPAVDEVFYDVRRVDASGWPIDVLQRYSGVTLMGATATPFGAQAAPAIWLDDMERPARTFAAGAEIPLTETPETVDDGMPALLASAVPDRPPREWFDTPEMCFERVDVDPSGREILAGPFTLDQVAPENRRPAALTFTDDGHVYGHAAGWGTCHIAHEACVTAPTSPSAYQHFHTGQVLCAGGERIAVGQITLGTGHADDRATAAMTRAHYDHTGHAVADVRASDGTLGVWISGAVRPGLSDGQMRALLASAPSGDWRNIGGWLELVGVLCVNVPGFPVPRARAVVASGVQTSLVAAGIPRAALQAADGGVGRLRAEIAALQARLDALGRLVEPLRPLAMAALVPNGLQQNA